MPRALNLLRPDPTIKREIFTEGLRAAGFDVVDRIDKPNPHDAVLIWNRYKSKDAEAKRFRNVLVAENAYVRVKGWYALARDHHAGLGRWHVGGPERWNTLGVELQPWRTGKEVVILGQRSMGEPGIASPKGWEESIARKVGGRIRKHPGRDKDSGPLLERDLENAGCVVTWASVAAFKALAMGIPCFYGLRGWIGAPACRHVDEFANGPLFDYAARLGMFQRLAWGQAHSDEIRSGEAICRLIELSPSTIPQRTALGATR